VLWIQIRVPFHLALLDPDRYWECGSDPGAWKLAKTYKVWFSAFQNAVVHTFVGMFFDLLPKCIFHVKIQLFVIS